MLLEYNEIHSKEKTVFSE